MCSPTLAIPSVFAAAQPGQPYARVWNEQLIRYAGYRGADGCPVGDMRQEQFTAAMQSLGWRGKGEQFDVLPLAIETPAEGVRLYESAARDDAPRIVAELVAGGRRVYGVRVLTSTL